MNVEKEYLVFDLETQRSASEVGGWGNAQAMGLSCAVIYSSRTGQDEIYYEKDVEDLVTRLQGADLVVGFNILGFDYKVLSGYRALDYNQLRSLDLLADLYRRLRFRVSLDNVAQATLGIGKSGDGLQSLEWWRTGQVEKVVAYCRQDVAVTKRIYEYGLENDFVQYKRRDGQRGMVLVDWKKK